MDTTKRFKNENQHIKEQISMDEVCVICLDPFESDKKDSISLLCDHRYHTHCFFGYLYYTIKKGHCSNRIQKQLHCPMCRRNDFDSLRNIAKTTIKTNELLVLELSEIKSTKQRQYILMKWSFKIKALWKQPSKMKIFEYIQKEDSMYEQLHEIDSNIKSLKQLNEKMRVVLQFVNSCVRCL
jgi:hypothetical protein